MPVQVELRQRLFHFCVGRSPKPQHGHGTEYAVELSFILANLLFVAGSICFFDSETRYVGALCFLAGSGIFAVLAAVNMLEQQAFRAHFVSEHQLLGAPEAGEHALPRALENGCYFVASLLFVLGSLLYVHRFYYEVKDEEIGAWLFIWGSLGYALASYFNALDIPHVFAKEQHWRGLDVNFPPEVTRAAYRLAAVALCCTQIGSICFVTGSYLYRPALATKCAEHDDDEVCVSSLPQGTWLYTIGSVLFLVQSFLNLRACVLKDRASAAAQAQKGSLQA